MYGGIDLGRVLCCAVFLPGGLVKENVRNLNGVIEGVRIGAWCNVARADCLFIYFPIWDIN